MLVTANFCDYILFHLKAQSQGQLKVKIMQIKYGDVNKFPKINYKAGTEI